MVYLILGDDIFLQTEAIDKLVAGVKKTHGEGLHSERNDAETFGLPACIEAVQNVSMWGSHTLVVVRNIDEWDLAKAEQLLDYAKSPNPASTLILQADKVDGRIKVVQQLKAACKMIECKAPYARQIPEWLRTQARGLDKQLSQEAANWCMELAGTDLATLYRALQGLSLYVGTKPTIDLADVEGFLSNTSQHDIFELCKALGSGRTPDAVNLLNNLFSNGEPPVRMMFMIARHWRILLGLRSAATTIESDEVLRQFRLPPFFLKEYQEQARRWEPKRLMRGLSILAKTDRRLKSARLNHKIIAELAMLSL